MLVKVTTGGAQRAAVCCLCVQTLDQSAGLVNGARGVVTGMLAGGAGVTMRLMSGAEVEIRHETWTAVVGGRCVRGLGRVYMAPRLPVTPPPPPAEPPRRGASCRSTSPGPLASTRAR